MHLQLVLVLLPLVAGHFHHGRHHGAHHRKTGNDYDDRQGEPSMRDQRTYWHPRRDQYDNRRKYPIPRGGPLSRSPWLMSLVHGISENGVHKAPEINLKLSGQVNLVHTIQGMSQGSMGMFRPFEHYGGPRWMHRPMFGPMAKVIWFQHMMDIHKKFHDMMGAKKDKLDTHDDDDDDDDDEDDDEDDEGEDEDEDEDEDEEENTVDDEENNPKGTRINTSYTSCPFWITKQFLKLCNCSRINGKMQSVLGYPIQPFYDDPMKVFNNTPGLKEWESGNIRSFMTEIRGIAPFSYRKLFFAGMIKSMCRQAKSFIGSIDQLQKKAAVMTLTAPVKLASVQSRDTAQGSSVGGSRGSPRTHSKSP
ncbi:uncharacterized protein LOC124116492 [Haliotis rufescens]|uniref:uncharacterized protein LOC124116492 n=1 Tax=Haliotis rufescens TaxID=6454 RepID=UPI00201EF6A8|nr:uncharacterized protein LOC124116492 [Haliotis rufescens]